MVDFAALSKRTPKSRETNPLELFRTLSKSDGINDLWDIQANALRDWASMNNKKDVVIKMPTGSGKTLVGLLIAKASANELHKGSLYLVENRQLVEQTVRQARRIGINAAPYDRYCLGAAFHNGECVVVGPYQALFNGKSRFGLKGRPNHTPVGTIILDDAHASLSAVSQACSVFISAEMPVYLNLLELFRESFERVGCATLFREIVSGVGGYTSTILEVPASEWMAKDEEVYDIISDAVRCCPESSAGSLHFGWPLLKDNLRLCRAIVSRRGFTIMPYLPLTNHFPSFVDADRRLYMSATFSDDTEIVKTFGASLEAIKGAITPHSLAGVGKRMILPVPEDVTRNEVAELAKSVSKMNLGAVVEVSSGDAALRWNERGAIIAQGENANEAVDSLVSGDKSAPVVLVNRYDGVDLPGDACRLIVMDGLPRGRSDAESLDDIRLYGSGASNRQVAQRIEQGMGRGARGSSDYCAILLLGRDLYEWVNIERNSALFTDATRAQIAVGSDIADEIQHGDFFNTVMQGVTGDEGFLAYCASRTAETVKAFGESNRQNQMLEASSKLRKAWEKWIGGNYRAAIDGVVSLADELASSDRRYAGVLLQMAAAIAYDAKMYVDSERYQSRAHGLNDALNRPIQFVTAKRMTAQAARIVERLNADVNGRGLASVEHRLNQLGNDVDHSVFEEGLKELGYWLGFDSERYDKKGDGPDVYWLSSEGIGFVLEAKNEKNEENSLTKSEHGQLLVAMKWANDHHPDVKNVGVSVHPSAKADKIAYAEETLVLTNASAIRMKDRVIGCLRLLYGQPNLSSDLEERCQSYLMAEGLTPTAICERWLETFSAR